MKLAFSTRVVRAKEQGKWKFWTFCIFFLTRLLQLEFWSYEKSPQLKCSQIWLQNKNRSYFELILVYSPRIQVKQVHYICELLHKLCDVIAPTFD